MAKNSYRLRHSRVAQHASVCMEMVKPSRPPIGETSFDPEVLTSGAHVSPALSFRRRVSFASYIASKAHETQQKEHVVAAPIPGIFSGGPYDTSLLPLYADCVSMHVWKG